MPLLNSLAVLLVLVALLLSPVTTVAQLSCDDAVQDHLEGNFGFPNKIVADTEIAVGMDRMLTCSNLFLRLLDKSGQLVSLGPAKLGNYTNHPTLSAFMFPVAGNPGSNDQVVIGDPMVYFDYEDERFWVVAVEVHSELFVGQKHSSVHIAVSATGAPTSWEAIGQSEPNGWYKYHYCLWGIDDQCLNTKGVGHNQTIYVDGDTLYIAFLDDSRGASANAMETTLMMIDKDDLMGGTQATPQFIRLADSPYNEDTWGHTVAVEYDAWDNDDPVYTVASGNPPNFPNQPQDTIIIGAIVKSGSTFSYVSHSITTSEGLPPWHDNAIKSAAPSGTTAVDVIGRPFLHATYRHDGEVGGRIWACAHIRDVDGQSPVGGNFVRYFEIHTNGWPNSSSAPTLAYYGDITFEGGETYDPSIAVNSAGHIGLTWTQSSSTTYPEFWMGVQRSFDTPGTLGFSQEMQNSSHTRSNPHKADYSGMEPDPEDPCRFWGHSMLAPSSTTWDSYVSLLCVPDCDADSYADQDANQEYDAFDVLIFSERFRAGDPRADCNGDRTLDVMDYLCFNSLFSAGGRR